jgi:predicted PurR-regulated permease PerM
MAVFLWIVGVDFALLWGLLFTVMVFVPAVGLLIASVPPIVMAYLEFGLTGAVIVTVGTVLITNVVSQLLKPVYVGRGLNVSRLWVFVSVIVWGAALGPVGALLAVPLTLVVKMVLASFDETRWLAAVMSERALEPTDAAPAEIETLEPKATASASSPV